MAGLYIHVPFCGRRCVYCDFYSTTDIKLREAYLAAICKEMEQRKEYLEGEEIETIYFGGGTPSQLSVKDFEVIFDTIYRLYPVSPQAEITLEANPDDMTPVYVEGISRLPFNRVSMGVQSFDEQDLSFLQRRHTGDQAKQAVLLCKENGLHSISIDLIYALPNQTPDKWKANITEFLKLDVPHLSAYHLIYEEDTPLFRLKEKGAIRPVDEDTSVSLFNDLIDRVTDAGYLHYEISNFAKPDHFSLHNSSYWKGIKYLGIGPSAHSYNIEGRQWNISSLKQYIEGINKGIPFVEDEVLNLYKRYNDYIITGLRTMWGISLSYILTNFGEEMQKHCFTQATPYLNQELLVQTGDKVLLSRAGMFISDSIMSDLLWI